VASDDDCGHVILGDTAERVYTCNMKIQSSFSARVLFFSVLFLSHVFVSAQKNKTSKPGKGSEKIVSELDALFAKSIIDYNVPGMAIAIVKDGQVVLSKGYGVKNAETKEPVDANSLFAIASNSKAFTAAALATLVDEGKIKWEDKVRKYLPYFELYSPYVSEEMTVRDLLCHRSGLNTFSGDLIWYGTTYSREEVIRRAKYLEPSFGFREAYGYSNIMFLAAGEIIPAVTGKSWDEYIKEKFFTPLGMTSANTSIRAFTPSSNVASPHNEVNGKNVPIEYVNWDNISSAGSINACVNDLSKWLKLQLGKGTLDGKTFWKEARSYEMWENMTPKPVSKWARENMPSRHFNGYGLGWELMEYGGKKIVSHGGGYDGMISKTVLVPELNLGFVILTNNINSLPSCLMYEVLDRYLQVAEHQEWEQVFLKMKLEDEAQAKEDEALAAAARVKDTKPSLPLKDYCGVYSSPMYGDVEVRLVGEKLAVDFKPTALFKGNLSHWHYDTFEISWSTQMMLPKGKITFILNADGLPEEMKVDVPNPDFDFSELKLKKKN
jgi:CubicO group peptidase (beta-lactamase class C family)